MDTYLGDKRLTLKAKGIMGMLIDLVDNKTRSVNVTEAKQHMLLHSKTGREAVETGLHELMDAGYIARVQTRKLVPDAYQLEFSYQIARMNEPSKITDTYKENLTMFRELNLKMLSNYAEDWADKFSEAKIKRIILYNVYPMTFDEESLKCPHQYAIVFEVDKEDKRLLHAVSAPGLHYFITAAFTNVYRGGVHEIDPRRKDWFFTVKFKNTELNANIRTEEPHVVLWQRMGGYGLDFRGN